MKNTLALLAGLYLTIPAIAATPIHYYNFNGANVTDSVGSAPGTLLNGAAVSGGLLHLDGIDDYVQFATNLIPTTGPFSVTFFARELTPANDPTEMISQGSSFGPGFYVGKYSGMMRIGDDWQNTGVAAPSTNSFHHFAVTMDGTTTKFYLDGVLVASSTAIAIADSGDFTRLGRQFYYPQEDTFGPEMFHGDLDELRIYNSALNANEVAALAVVPEPGIAAFLALSVLALLRRRH